MNTCIALLRGINVTGNNLLPMKGLAALMESLGCRDVKTYIQSGNVVFRYKTAGTSTLAKRISAAIQKHNGFEPQVLILTAADLERAMKQNPFPEAESTPQTLHLYFLIVPSKHADMSKLENVKAHNERFTLKGNVLYLHAPDGIGRSKLAAQVERALGVPVTARNWRTVSKLAEMARENSPNKSKNDN